MAGWTLDDVCWHRFDRSRVDPAQVAIVKAARMVEANAADYRSYLCNVFAGDSRLCRATEGWAVDEAQHSTVRRWGGLPNPVMTSWLSPITPPTVRPAITTAALRPPPMPPARAPASARTMVRNATVMVFNAVGLSFDGTLGRAAEVYGGPSARWRNSATTSW